MNGEFDTYFENPSQPSADNLDLKFSVWVATNYGASVFSRHETAEEAQQHASRLNETAAHGQRYEACDELDNLLTEGYFRKEEERYEDMVANLKL
jgi:hypothetical protein